MVFNYCKKQGIRHRKLLEAVMVSATASPSTSIVTASTAIISASTTIISTVATIISNSTGNNRSNHHSLYQGNGVLRVIGVGDRVTVEEGIGVVSAGIYNGPSVAMTTPPPSQGRVYRKKVFCASISEGKCSVELLLALHRCRQRIFGDFLSSKSLTAFQPSTQRKNQNFLKEV